MADLPSVHETDVFTRRYDGVFGRFKIAQSYEINYLLSALRTQNLDQLETAKRAFPFGKVNFDELIQRDIDYDRVDKEIVSEYLKGDQERVLFFPPLLVSVVPIDPHGGPIEQYSSVITDVSTPDRLCRTWDIDKFRIELHTRTSTNTGYAIDFDGGELHYLPYAATLACNPETVRLVVIDGQHRFEALRQVRDSDRDLMAAIQVPVCFLFSPTAVIGNEASHSITRDLRELFVTINSTSKAVSGHFLTLLRDRSISAQSVRLLANAWKEHPDGILPLLEWNTRDAAKAAQLQKHFSLTTVTIIADALEKYCFRNSETSQLLLNLTEVRVELESPEDATPIDLVKEDTFGYSQLAVIKRQVSRYLVPALSKLFLLPTPYAEHVNRFRAATAWLKDQAAAGVRGARQYHDDILYGFRSVRTNDQDCVRDMSGNYEDRFKDASGQFANNCRPYFYNVFQQGLVCAWVACCKELTSPGYGIHPEAVAHALVVALNQLCFRDDTNYFNHNTKPYVRQTLFRGEKFIVSEKARERWASLMLAALANNKVRKRFQDEVAGLVTLEEGAMSRIGDSLAGLGVSRLQAFLKDLQYETEKQVRRQWRFLDLGRDTEVYLSSREKDASPERRVEFDTKLAVITSSRFEAAQAVLLNVLDVSKDALLDQSDRVEEDLDDE